MPDDMHTADDGEVMGRTVANPFREIAPVHSPGTALISVEQQRAVAEVQARMMIARANPRDPIRCMDLILQDCTRPTLAETALYQYSRGGSAISGPSIRLAESIARRWGNIASGIKELSRQNGYSECKAYAWDLESGYYDEREFQVRHWRDTKKGGYPITDERDIYELIANMGQRRKRAVLLTVIPGDVVEAATNQCEETLKASADTSPDALKKMVQFFGAYGVTQAQIEARCQCHLEAIRPAQLVQLRKIYASLKDGMSEPDDWFTPTAPMENRPGAKLDRFETKHSPPAPEPDDKPSPFPDEAAGERDPSKEVYTDPEWPHSPAHAGEQHPFATTGTGPSGADGGNGVGSRKDGDGPNATSDASPSDPSPEVLALIARGQAAAARGTDALQSWWQNGLSALQRGALGARGRGVGPYLESWKIQAAAIDARASERAPVGDLLGEPEQVDVGPQSIVPDAAAPAPHSADRPRLDIDPVLKNGKPDWRTWTLGVFMPKLRRFHDDVADLAFFIADNEENIGHAKAAGFKEEIDAAISEQFRVVDGNG